MGEKRMRLDAVKRGRIDAPMRVLLFGVEGIGKSTFAASAPDPIFLAAEDGTSQLDVARFPEPQSWSDVLDAIAALTAEQHEYRTLVIDTLDWLEPLCWEHVCARPDERGKRRASIEDFGYGKGYTAALDEWRVLLAAIERLRRAKGMHVVMVAHSWAKTFKNPEDEDFDRYELKLHAKAGGLLKEWSDAVLFAKYETFANVDSKTKRVRGVSTGARIIHTQRTAAFDAKNRYNLPERLPLDWQAFVDAVESQRPADPAIIKARIETMLAQAEDLRAAADEAVTKAGDDPSKLAKIADRLAARVQIRAQENAQ